MKKLWLGIVLTMFLASCAFAQTTSNVQALRPYHKGQAPQPPCNGACVIVYNGGPVFEATPRIYIIWYGKWTTKDRSVIDYYFTHLGGSTQNKINTTYSDSTGGGKFVPNKVNHSTKNDYHDNYSAGKSIGQGNVESIIAKAIKNKHLPVDVNGIYFLLTSADVQFGGFCSSFCGYHSPSTSIVSGKVIKYSWVGNPAQCPSACETSNILGDPGSPNNDPGADGATAIMWHEFSETVSDPEVNLNTAWVSNACGESGDCCAWIFGTVKTDSHGHKYTNVIKGKEYAMQEMFKLTSKSRNGNVPGVCNNVF